MYTFKLSNYKASKNDRFIIYDDINKKVYKKIIIDSNDVITTSDKNVISNVDNYKFKFQRKIQNQWQDIHKYFKILRPQQLGDYWADNIIIDEITLVNYITYYSNTNSKFSRIRFLKAFKQICEKIWLGHNHKHKNLYDYINFSEKNEHLFNLEWKNLNVYLKYLLRMKNKFQKYNYNNLYYNELQPVILKNDLIIEFIEHEINELKTKDLQFAYLLIAQYYSLINRRSEAVTYFEKVKSYKNNMENEFLVGQGSATYSLLNENRQQHTDNVVFHTTNENNDSDYTLLVSVDSKYLQRYGPIIFYNLIALQKYHFHFHVVGENEVTGETIKNALKLYNEMKHFIGKNSYIIDPTFSSEELPKYANNLKSFSATARFINASYFMDKFGTNLLILDADMFLTDDLTSYFNSIKMYDVSIAFSQSVTTTLPWRRVMAGNIYLSNNEKAKRFIDITKDYIVDNLKEKQSWTLDQNALTYAFENIFDYYPDISFGNVYKYKNRPFSHPAIRTYIERD